MSESSKQKPKIVVTTNGPYLVFGAVPLGVESITPNAEGGSWSWTKGRSLEAGEKYALCRCGLSATKPFCDGTHAKAGFDGTETASREAFADRAETIEGPVLDLQDVEALCAFARFCDNQGGIWELVGEAADAERERVVVREGTYCPSGRLVLRDKREQGAAIEPNLPVSLSLVEDPAKDSSGPIWVRGGIRIESQDGTPYEVRNRQTLCRCGASSNKPFCDGTHASIAFVDGL